jgi:hypothetical protein
MGRNKTHSPNGRQDMKKFKITAVAIAIAIIGISIFLYPRVPYCITSKSDAEERAFFAMMVDAESNDKQGNWTQSSYLNFLLYKYKENEIRNSYFDEIDISKYQSLAFNVHDKNFAQNKKFGFNYYKLHVGCDVYIFQFKEGERDTFLEQLNRTEE